MMLPAERPPSTTTAEPDGDLGRTSGATVVSGGLWSIVGRMLPQVQLLLLSVVAARFLGPDGMGRQSLIAFVGLTTVMVATAGFPASVARFVGELLGARRGGDALALYAWTWRFEVVAAVLAGGGLALVGLLGSDPRLAWVLVGGVSALAVLQSVPQALLSGAQRWRHATMVGLVTGAASVPGAIVALALGGGISGLFAVELVMVAVNLGWTSHLARGLASQLPPRAAFPADLRRRFTSFAGITTITVMLHYVVWTRSELLVLDHSSTDTQIALYSIAFATVSGLARIPEAIARVTMPAVATLIGAGELDRVRSGYWRAMRLLAFLTPPVVAGAAVTGPALISLAYGSEFQGAGTVLLVMLGPLLLVPLFTTAESLLFALGRLRFLLGVQLCATVVDIGLAVLLIPRFDALGAAFANAAAQFAAGVPFLVVAGRLQAPANMAWGALLRGVALACAVAAAAGGTLLALGDGVVGVPAAIVAGIAAFAALGPVLRPLAADDAVWLARALEGRDPMRRVLRRTLRGFSPAPRPVS
jgi:O-antigen/teichoic acid export membrane protein